MCHAKTEIEKRKSRLVYSYVLCMGLLFLFFFTGCQKEQDEKNGREHWQDTDFAMGTVIAQNIYGGSGEETSNEVLQVIQELEHTISWRIDTSPVSALNQAAGTGKEIEIGEKLAKWLTDCEDVYKQSKGALDITVGPASRLWDIGGDNPKVASPKEIEEILPLIDGSKLSIDGEKASLDIKGGQLDLGAVGKGIACDEIRDMLRKQPSSDSGSLINGTFSVGGSILVYGRKPDESEWKIGIQNPRGEEGENMGAITVAQTEAEECFISTSGDYEKYIEEDGIRYHHIMDPRTGSPADSGLISVTIVSKSGFLSDALSTACFVTGLEDGKKLVSHYGAEAIFIDKEKKVTVTEGLKENFTVLEKEYQLINETK